MRKELFLAGLIGLAGLVDKANASIMTFGNTNAPNNGIEYNASTGYISIPFEVTNNDSNIFYSEATVNSTRGDAGFSTSCFKGLRYFSNYSTITGMLTGQTDGKDNAYLLLDSADGYVNNGWDVGFNFDGSIKIFHPHPVAFESWSNDLNINNHTAAGTLAIGSWLYDRDGNTANLTLDKSLASFGDAIPNFDPTSFITDAAVETTVNGGSRSAEGNYLNLDVIPEPAVLGLVALGGLSLLLSRKRN